MTRQRLAALMLGGFLVALIVVVWKDSGPEITPAPAPVEAARPSPIDDVLARPPLKIVDHPEPVRSRSVETPAKVPESFENVAGTECAVVAAIYKEYEAAERRARSMAAETRFRPTVFPEKGQGSKYMVVLGSGLTRAKAEELRLQAGSAGLPEDTYVTKLNP